MDERLRIGELARATGLTVRTLHHYDAIGLLAPSERAANGYRLYGAAAVERLYRIRALRALGLPLEEIRDLLARSGDDPRDTVARHIERLDEQLELATTLRRRLVRIGDALARSEAPSQDDLLQAIEVMTMSEQYYTPEQLETLERRRAELGADGLRAAEQEWADLIAAVEVERAAGTDPHDPRVKALATRWRGLIEQFTGGDDGIRDSLKRMYAEQGPERASRGAVNPELLTYVMAAMAER